MARHKMAKHAMARRDIKRTSVSRWMNDRVAMRTHSNNPLTDVWIYIAVFLGGSCGTALRYVLGRTFNVLPQPLSIHWGTLTANLIACFGYALLSALLLRTLSAAGATLRSKRAGELTSRALGMGFCGGLSTMSTLTLEITAGQYGWVYAIISLLSGVLFALLGSIIGNAIGSYISGFGVRARSSHTQNANRAGSSQRHPMDRTNSHARDSVKSNLSKSDMDERNPKKNDSRKDNSRRNSSHNKHSRHTRRHSAVALLHTQPDTEGQPHDQAQSHNQAREGQSIELSQTQPVNQVLIQPHNQVTQREFSSRSDNEHTPSSSSSRRSRRKRKY